VDAGRCMTQQVLYQERSNPSEKSRTTRRSASLPISHHKVAMLGPTSKRCASAALNPSPSWIVLPSFLLPAFQSARPSFRTFSTSRPAQSKIGKAPLSVPPEVTFDVIPVPDAKGKPRAGRAQLASTVNIKGPLGALQCQFIHSDV
jgi:hypothetical protein